MGSKTMRFQWVKVLMKRGKPYFVRIESSIFIDTIPWVARCLEDHGISSDKIKQYMIVTGHGRTPKRRIFYYERPVGLRICDGCGKLVPEDTNICLSCGVLFNKRLIELTNNGKT